MAGFSNSLSGAGHPAEQYHELSPLISCSFLFFFAVYLYIVCGWSNFSSSVLQAVNLKSYEILDSPSVQVSHNCFK